jgi:ribosome-binding protein aMBF1 (putative translation factor)
MNTNNQKLADFAAKKPSHWLKNAQHRRENKKWLAYSFQIAIKVLAAIDATPGMTQKKLAELIGVSPQYISKILKGQENLTLETISKLEDALGVNLFSFADQESEPVFSDLDDIISTGDIAMVKEDE